MDLAGRVFSQQLDRDKPLWEIWLVEGLEDDRFALLAKTHHALVDGVSGIDIVSVLFDTSPEPAAPADPGRALAPAPAPLAAPSCSARRWSSAPPCPARSRAPCARSSAARAACSTALKNAAVGVGAHGLGRASTRRPPAPTTRPIGPHRRFTWVRAELRDIKAIKDSLGGTVNDVVLATVAGALGRHLRRRGQPDRRPRAQGDDPGQRALGRGARRARQPRGGDDGPAPGLVPGAAGAPRPRAPRS